MTTLTIRRKALAKQERYRKSRLRKYRRGWRRLLAEHFVARLLCRLATIVFQHEQPERRREITVLALLIDATDNSDNVTWRSPAISFSAVQNSSSRLTLVLRPASKIERLTTSDFMRSPLHMSAPWYQCEDNMASGYRAMRAYDAAQAPPDRPRLRD